VNAVRAYFEHTIDTAFLASMFPRLEAALETMLRGTRGGVSADPSDGLLRAGEDDVDATWMDQALRRADLAPRHGKAVEVNALWYNAHTAMAAFGRRLRRHVERWEARAARIETGFARFWNPAQLCLFDVLDGPFGIDASVRPNQLFALSLPDSPLSAARRRAVLTRCMRDLVTSHGVRGLTKQDPRYVGSEGEHPNGAARAAALGSAWVWLLPNAAMAMARVLGNRDSALEALEALEALSRDCGLGLMPDRADGDPPHAPRGGFEGALPVAETLRVFHALTGERRDLRRREMTRAREVDPEAPVIPPAAKAPKPRSRKVQIAESGG
jgi:glycogen debranching enzyme